MKNVPQSAQSYLNEALTPQQRQTHLGNMFTLALESAIQMA